MSDAPPPARRRVSITKLQRNTAAAVELISLCQCVTSDGQLSDEEIASLRQWSDDNAAVDLPARGHVRDVLTQILADGVVTEQEREELYLALETVLPPDIRAPVRARRREVEETQKAQERRAREEHDAKARLERARNRSLDAWNFMVAGVRHEGRPAIIQRHAQVDADVYLKRDRTNRFSRSAVVIQLRNGMQIGFVPEVMAREMAPMLDAGYPYLAFITKILTGGRSPIPVVQADLYGLDATLPELVRPGSEPDLVRAEAVSRTGCMSVVVISAIITARILLA
jgi:hypothetical protein